MKFCNCRRTLDIYNQGLLISPNVITRKSLLRLGQKVIISKTLLHLGSFITFWPSRECIDGLDYKQFKYGTC